MKNQRVEACLEKLCKKGCRSVWGYIDTLEDGRQLAETRDLNPYEVELLVDELKEVMAVYEGSCSVS